MSDNFHSDDYNKKDEKFKKGLIEIDKKYIKYFKSRQAIFLSQKHDEIINHFIMQNTVSGQITININSTELPLEIKDDLLSLFNRCWV